MFNKPHLTDCYSLVLRRVAAILFFIFKLCFSDFWLGLGEDRFAGDGVLTGGEKL